MNRQQLLRIVLVATAVGFLVACGSDETAKPSAGETIRGVEFETVRLADSPTVYEATGTVRSATTSAVAAQLSGTVREMHVKAGDLVRRGQVVAVLDDRTPRAQLAAAEAGLEEAAQGQAEIEQALQAAAAERQFAEVTYKRYQELLGKNSVSKQEFDGAESRYKAALAHERAFLAKKKQVEARGQQALSQKQSAQAVFSYSRVVAPISGIISIKSVDVGTVVMPGDPIVTVEDPNRYRLEASVPAQYISSVRAGMKIPVEVNRGKFDGRVAEIVPSADTTSRSFLVKIDLPRECGCRSGEYGTAGFPIGEEKRITVPQHSVLEHGQLEGVFVVNSQDVLEFRLVKTGKGSGERVEILSGLAEGDKVAISQVEKLRDGARVEEQ